MKRPAEYCERDIGSYPGDRRPAILLVAFGASSAEARGVYDHIGETVQRHKPGHDIFWAFTSRRIVARLRSEGIVLPTLEEAKELMQRRGQRQAVLLPLLTVPGEEYASVAAFSFAGLQVVCCPPLLSNEKDIPEVLDALDDQLHEDAVNVLVCHGNAKHDVYNDLLVRLAAAIESAYGNCVVASVEGRPGTKPLHRAREIAQSTGRAHFVPFMMVSGEHVTSDVMGDKPESWKNRVGAATSTCAQSLGWKNSILNLFLKRLDEGFAQLEMERCHEPR